MQEQKEKTATENKESFDEKPDYQEKITFLISTVAQGFILAWCLLVLSLGYIKLPNKLFGVDIPDISYIIHMFHHTTYILCMHIGVHV